MQRLNPHKRRRKLWTLLVILLTIAAIVAGVVLFVKQRPVTTVTAYKLPCAYNDSLRAFGNNVLFYDGVALHCMNNHGTVKWSFQIGESGGFECDDKTIVAWVGRTIYIIDENGFATYNDNLGDDIQFARVGAQYVAAVIGEDTSPRLVVKDHQGAHMDEEADAYKKLLILDMGFYGKNSEYMWTLALDVFGTAANTILNTFEVGKMNTGEVSLGEPITYGVIYENSRLRVINTRKMLSYNYRGTEDTESSVLIYGWRLLDKDIPEKGDAQILFAPTKQTDNQFDIRELRLISGTSIDKRYSLPDTCIGATVRNRSVYAVSGTTLYRAAINDIRFTEYELPLEQPATRFISALKDGYILLACGADVYVCSLPQAGI